MQPSLGKPTSVWHDPNVVLSTRQDGVRIVRVSTLEQSAAYSGSFAGAYQDIFSEPPYNERFFPSEAQGMLKSYLETPDNIVLLAVTGRYRVVGFSIGIPLETRPDVSRQLRGLVMARHTFYFAELGVLSGSRRAGIGKELVDTRMDLVDSQRFSSVVLRTSALRNETYEMYMARGFDDMGVYMEVPARRLNGRVTTDRRLFLSKVLT